MNDPLDDLPTDWLARVEVANSNKDEIYVHHWPRVAELINTFKLLDENQLDLAWVAAIKGDPNNTDNQCQLIAISWVKCGCEDEEFLVFRPMSSFDGEYNGLLVKDWGDEEWARYYHDYYAPREFAEDQLNSPWTKQLFCGPDIELTDELFETVNSADGHINHFDGPICYYRNNDNGGLTGEKSKQYFENYPYPPVYERLMVKFRERTLIANQKAEGEREMVYAQYSLTNIEELERHVGGQCWLIRKGYGSEQDEIKLRFMIARLQQLKPDAVDSALLEFAGMTV